MKVISVVSQKGGSGKSTITQCLAIEALKHGNATAVIDADPQGSTANWGKARAAKGINVPLVISLGANPLSLIIQQLKASKAAFVVIDTPPHSAPAINAALEVSSGAVMVTRPNPMDIEALEATWAIVSRINRPSAVIFTQSPPGQRARALALAQGRIQELGIPYCATPLSYALSYPYAQAESLTVQEREPTGKARAELAEVWAWFKRAGII